MFVPKAEFIGLYFAYMISCFGDRIWVFSIIFILAELGGIRLVTISLLIQGLIQMVLASYVGNWYDRSGRWLGAQACLLFNNISVAISAGFLFFCLIMADEARGDSAIYLISLMSAIGFCALSMAAASGEKTAFSKDYIVVMVSSLYSTESTQAEPQKSTKSNSTKNYATNFTSILARENGILRVIDRSSAILSPIIGGLILDFFGLKAMCFIMIGWNVAGWIVESLTLHWVYKQVSALAVKKKVYDNLKIQPKSLSIVGMFKAYFIQEIFPAALGLSFLYVTVLAFDGISIGFGKKQGLDSTIIGVFRALGSTFGLLAAITYPFFERKIGLRRSAFFGLSIELGSLIICVISVFLPGSPFDPIGYFRSLTWKDWWDTFSRTFDATLDNNDKSENSTGMDWSEFTVNNIPATSLFFFYSGITLARFGLWLTDLSITQLMQESVDESIRGTIFGVHTSLCLFFSVCKDIIAILLPDSKTFGLLIFISVIAVGSAFFLFFYFQIRKVHPKEQA